MIITLAGHHGAGKSSLSKGLANHYGLRTFSAGGFLRELGSEQGMTILEISEAAKHDGGVIDFKLEERSRELGETEDNFVIDGRLAYYIIPHGIRLFLTVSPEVAAKRISDHGRPEESYSGLEHAIADIYARREAENERYMKYYGVHIYDMAQYDYVIDTENFTQEEVLARAISCIDEMCNNSVIKERKIPNTYFEARMKYLGY